MISGSLACGVRAARIKNGFFIEAGPVGRTAVNFVGADVHESRKFAGAGGLQQTLRTADVAAKEGRGIFDAAIDMSLRREVYQRIKAAFAEVRNGSRIVDISEDKVIARSRGQVI